jgi:hypothetical protein
MGVTPKQLAEYYPRLFHMAHYSSWDNICSHGLLSTEALLDLYEVSDGLRELILTNRRTQSIHIQHPIFGKAVIRDQKPLIPSKLEGRLVDCTFHEWLKTLNSRVFFWLTEDRLKTLMCAREYRNQMHVVLVLDTLRLATDFRDRITLSPLNTGNTQPIAHPRGIRDFCHMQDYPFDERLQRGPYYRVVELSVEGKVSKILDYVIEARIMKCDACAGTDSLSIKTVKKLYP